MRRQVAGMFLTDGLWLVKFILIITTIQVTCAHLPSKDQRAKGYLGLLKDLEASRNKKPSLLDEEGLRFKKGSSLLDDEGMRFKKGASLLNDEGMRFKKGASLLNDEGMRFKKESSLLNDEGMRFKKGSYLEDEGLRFKKMPRDLFEPNAKIRKSVLDGEGLRFKKESSLLDDEGMRFRRSKMTPLDRQNEGEMIKRYGFPGRLFSFYPFTMDLSNSYERRSDRSGNKDILEGEGMRF